jgi:uncharacterized protein (DUF1778 family)
MPSSADILLPERGRITARISAQVQEKLETAAEMLGSTLNQFIVQSALREAERIIAQERLIHLDSDATQAFLAAIDAPPQPNPALLAALQNYSDVKNDQTGNFDWQPRPQQL